MTTTTTLPTMPASMVLIVAYMEPEYEYDEYGEYEEYGEATTTAEVLTGGANQIQLPNLPIATSAQSMINHYGTILHCGGSATDSRQSCLKLSNGAWVSHSTLNAARRSSGAATTNSGSFIFGGYNSDSTFEYMTKGNTNWQTGNQNIPNGYIAGCVIQISDEIIYLIGGRSSTTNYESRILAFDSTSKVFTTLSTKLITGRWAHSCEFIPNTNKVMISGGYGYNVGNLYVTEVLDITTGSTSHGPAMNLKRGYHGSGIITVDGEDRLAVFGGAGSSRRDSIELFNPQTNSWQMMSETLTEPKHAFGFLTIKEGDINDFLL